MDDDEDELAKEELRNLAGVTLQGSSMKSLTWPPRVVHYDDADQQRLALDRLEGRRGGKAGARDVPPLYRWPYYEIAISDVPLLYGDEAEFEHYRALDFTDTQEMAFKLAYRWKQFNTGRSLYFTETGAAKLSCTVVTVPILLRQVQGLFVLAQWIAERQAAGEAADFEEFLREKEADEATADELRTVLGLPLAAELALHGGSGARSARELMEAVHLDALVGREEGSALAAWALDPGADAARVEFCVGHDCMGAGPRAEEVLLRLVAAKAAERGATRLRCRVRFTEDGRFFVPGSLRQLGMQPLAAEEEMRAEFEEELEEEELGTKEAALIAEGNSVLVKEIPESVPGLRTWLTIQGIQAHLEEANAWCEEMGAATLQEVIEEREDLAESLGDLLSPAQKQCLKERAY